MPIQALFLTKTQATVLRPAIPAMTMVSPGISTATWNASNTYTLGRAGQKSGRAMASATMERAGSAARTSLVPNMTSTVETASRSLPTPHPVMPAMTMASPGISTADSCASSTYTSARHGPKNGLVTACVTMARVGLVVRTSPVPSTSSMAVTAYHPTSMTPASMTVMIPAPMTDDMTPMMVMIPTPMMAMTPQVQRQVRPVVPTAGCTTVQESASVEAGRLPGPAMGTVMMNLPQPTWTAKRSAMTAATAKEREALQVKAAERTWSMTATVPASRRAARSAR